MKNKVLVMFASVVVLVFLYACEQASPNKSITQGDKIALQEQRLTIDTFSAFPPEVEGCTCSFSNDSLAFNQGIYIYVNDYAQVSFLRINGVLTKFIQTDFKEVSKTKVVAKAKGGEYELTIEITDGKRVGEEASSKSGILKLTNKEGKTITKTFYGICGC